MRPVGQVLARRLSRPCVRSTVAWAACTVAFTLPFGGRSFPTPLMLTLAAPVVAHENVVSRGAQPEPGLAVNETMVGAVENAPRRTERGTAMPSLVREALEGLAARTLAERHDRDDLLAGIDLTGQDDRIAGILMDLARQETQPRAERLAQAQLTRDWRSILDELGSIRPSLLCADEHYCQRGKHRIVVAEELTPTLTVELDTSVGVIADSQGVESLAGIMGGAETEITSKTQSLLLESANFEPATIRRCATALGHRTGDGMPAPGGVTG